jgi:hypothetical protein
MGISLDAPIDALHAGQPHVLLWKGKRQPCHPRLFEPVEEVCAMYASEPGNSNPRFSQTFPELSHPFRWAGTGQARTEYTPCRPLGTCSCPSCLPG